MNGETILDITHWTDRLMSIRTTRSSGFRFTSGQFTMIGLEVDGRPLLRAYSITSPAYDDVLEFYSIKVHDGPLTSRLQHAAIGDRLLVGPKPVGTLLLGNLQPGGNLWLLSTGTGIAPFLSIIRDPETYERHTRVILVHCCRSVADLRYGQAVINSMRQHELLGEYVDRLTYLPLTTRDTSDNMGRITTLLRDGMLCAMVGQAGLDAANDRVMICGSIPMTEELTEMMLSRGFSEGSAAAIGGFVYERAFVGK